MHQLVEQSGWDQKKMREEPHEWVDVLVSLCTEVSLLLFHLVLA